MKTIVLISSLRCWLTDAFIFRTESSSRDVPLIPVGDHSLRRCAARLSPSDHGRDSEVGITRVTGAAASVRPYRDLADARRMPVRALRAALNRRAASELLAHQDGESWIGPETRAH
jgi:hypothetical protein